MDLFDSFSSAVNIRSQAPAHFSPQLFCRKVNYAVRSRILGFRFLWAPTFWGGKLLMPAAEGASLFYYGLLSSQEERTTLFLIKNLRDDDVFFDIGGHYGFFTILADWIIRRGEIHVFEPSPNNVFFLSQSVARARAKVFLNPVALGAKEGNIDFYDGYAEGRGGSSSMIKGISEKMTPSAEKIVVSCTTLDAYIRTHRAPRIIKVDVEGAESDIVKGARTLLAKKGILLIVEVWREPALRVYSERTIRELQKTGYLPFGIREDGSLAPLSSEDIFSDADYKQWGANIVFQKS